MIRIHKVVAASIVTLGLIYEAVTFCKGRWDVDVLWFMGSGFAIIFAGLLNIALLRVAPQDVFMRAMCVSTNVLVALLFCVAYFTVLHKPQAIIGVVLFSVAAVSSLFVNKL